MNGPGDAFDAEQMRQMQAMLSMAAGGMGGMGMAPPPANFAPGYPGPTPGVDPAAAYMQMLQHIQHQQQALSGGMPGMPGPMGMLNAPFPGSAPFPPPVPQEPIVSVSVEGMGFQYQLTEDDIHKVFRRYGHVKHVQVDEGCASARVTFSSQHDAQAAITDLDGKVLNGLNGTLRISWISSGAAPPYMLPGLGYPSQAQVPPVASPWPTASAASAGNYADASGPRDQGAKGTRKFTCRFLIGIDNDKEFQVARKLIGSKGCNMKRIVKLTGAKLRLRGVGSGYLEGASQKESSEPLQLCISCTSPEGYQTAVKQLEELLSGIYDDFRQFCQDHGRACPELSIKLSENQLVYSSRTPGVGEATGAPAVAPLVDGRGKQDGRPKGGGGGRGAGAKRGARAAAEGERGEPGANAPSVDEIQDWINKRNEARRSSNFGEADRIRESLYQQGVALMDDPGGRGEGAEVTTWRYWRE